MKPTDAKRMDYWDQFGDDSERDRDDQDDDAPETEPVAERLADEIEADRIHGFAVTRQQGETFYCVFSRSTTWDALDDSRPDIPVLDVRTAVVDLGDDNVRVSDNGIWVPQEPGVAESLTAILGRTTTDLSSGPDADPEAGPALRSAVDGLDPEDLLARGIETETEVDGQHVDKMESHGGIDPSRGWGYGAGPPAEVSTVVDRLTEAGLDPEDHLSRLVWGKKEPMDRTARPVDELTGNYGIELQPRDSGLVAIDVDYPDEFPQSELPETFEVSSPHGDDRRRHIVFRCDEKKRIADALTPDGMDGAWAVQSIDWGDLWIGDRYLVGPGSQLSEFGCDADGHTRGERGGCEACEDPDGGYYRVVSDKPIATVSADRILALLEESGWGDAELRNGPADNDPPETDDPEGDVDDLETCDSCGAARDPDDLETLVAGDTERQICRGECDE